MTVTRRHRDYRASQEAKRALVAMAGVVGLVIFIAAVIYASTTGSFAAWLIAAACLISGLGLIHVGLRGSDEDVDEHLP